jgi:hypothetical protein
MHKLPLFVRWEDLLRVRVDVRCSYACFRVDFERFQDGIYVFSRSELGKIGSDEFWIPTNQTKNSYTGRRNPLKIVLKAACIVEENMSEKRALKIRKPRVTIEDNIVIYDNGPSPASSLIRLFELLAVFFGCPLKIHNEL